MSSTPTPHLTEEQEADRAALLRNLAQLFGEVRDEEERERERKEREKVRKEREEQKRKEIEEQDKRDWELFGMGEQEERDKREREREEQNRRDWKLFGMEESTGHKYGEGPSVEEDENDRSETGDGDQMVDDHVDGMGAGHDDEGFENDLYTGQNEHSNNMSTSSPMQASTHIPSPSVHLFSHTIPEEHNPDDSDLDSTLLSSPSPSTIVSDDEADISTMKRGIVSFSTDFNLALSFPARPSLAERLAREAAEEAAALLANQPKKERVVGMAFHTDAEIVPGSTWVGGDGGDVGGGTVVGELSAEEKRRKREARKGKQCLQPEREKRPYRWKDEGEKNKRWLYDKRKADKKRMLEEMEGSDGEGEY